MTPSPRICLFPVLIALACVSCKDDPQLLEKRETQNTEIAKLNGELALIEEKLKNQRPDLTGELAKAEQEAENQTAEIARLETEVTKLSARKRAIQDEFDIYRSKYQVK